MKEQANPSALGIHIFISVQTKSLHEEMKTCKFNHQICNFQKLMKKEIQQKGIKLL